jgi:hypothetical protein
MPRRSRIEAAGALHHIMVRGFERVAVFRNDRDRDQFLERLGENRKHTKSICYALEVRGLGVPMSPLRRKFGISIPSVSESVTRGRRISEESGCFLMKT